MPLEPTTFSTSLQMPKQAHPELGQKFIQRMSHVKEAKTKTKRQ